MHSKEELEVKAEAANVVLTAVALAALETMESSIPAFQNLDKKLRDDIAFILCYVALFHAGVTYWNDIIQNEDVSKLFSDLLYKHFETRMKLDARPFIKDYIDYAKKIGDGGYIQYVGWKIAPKVAGQDVWLGLTVSTIYFDHLTSLLKKSLKKVWENSIEDNQDIVQSETAA